MTDFQAWNPGTHAPIVADDDWNNLLDHGLVKTANYIIRLNSSNYEAINGSTGKIVYGGASDVGGVDGADGAAVVQACVTALNTAKSAVTGRIVVLDDITLTSAVTIPAWEGFTMDCYGKITVTGAAAFILGNATNAVRTSHFYFAYMDGVNSVPNGIVINWAEWCTIEIGRATRFDNAVHFGPLVAQIGAASDNRLLAGTLALSNCGVKLVSYLVTEAISQGNHIDVCYIAGCVKGVWVTGDLTELNIFHVESHNVIGGVPQTDYQADNVYGQNLFITGYVGTVAGVGTIQDMIISPSWAGESRINCKGYTRLGDATGWGGAAAASVSYRGDMVFESGAAGVLDVAKICLKGADDAYTWHSLTPTWLDASVNIVGDLNRVATLDWTDMDLSAAVPAGTRTVMLLLTITIDTVGDAGTSCYVGVRKNGTAPTRWPSLVISDSFDTAIMYHESVTVGVDSGYIFEYRIAVGNNWQIDTTIELVGYQ